MRRRRVALHLETGQILLKIEGGAQRRSHGALPGGASGSWVVSPGPEGSIAVGVISVKDRCYNTWPTANRSAPAACLGIRIDGPGAHAQIIK